MSFIIKDKLHNRRPDSAPREHGPVVRLTGTKGKFAAYKEALAIIGATAADFVGLLTAQLEENGPEKAFIFVGDGGSKDEKGVVVNPTVGSQLTSVKNSAGTCSFSMGAAYASLKELFAAFKGGDKGAIKFTINAENVQMVDEYEGMKNVQMFELTPVEPTEEDEDDTDENDADDDSIASTVEGSSSEEASASNVSSY